jgi:hypothetical protein
LVSGPNGRNSERIFNIRVLRRIFRPKMDKVRGELFKLDKGIS